jgi:hypothetical protein
MSNNFFVNLFNYLRSIFTKINNFGEQIRRGKILRVIQKNRDFFVRTFGIFFFLPILGKLSTIIFHTVINISLGNKSLIDVILVISFFLLLLDFIISKTEKIKDKKRSNFISLRERIFVLLPYIWFWTEMTVSLVDDCVNFLEYYFPEDQVIKILENFIYPIIRTYSELPGIKIGILGYFIFYVKFFYIGRNKKRYSDFTRYYFMQSLLISMLFSLASHCYFLLINYEISEELTNIIGYSLYGSFLILIGYLMIFILMGKESRIPFLHQATEFQIGQRIKPRR